MATTRSMVLTSRAAMVYQRRRRRPPVVLQSSAVVLWLVSRCCCDHTTMFLGFLLIATDTLLEERLHIKRENAFKIAGAVHRMGANKEKTAVTQ